MRTPLKFPPPLDPSFLPASIWLRNYRMACDSSSDTREVSFTVERAGGVCWTFKAQLLPDHPDCEQANFQFSERLLKSLLWIWGGNKVSIHGAPEIAARLAKTYANEGKRHFDAGFMGTTCFDSPLSIHSTSTPVQNSGTSQARIAKGNLNGCRVGFDLGGSDRKCAAVKDGEVLFSEEVKWDPYFQSDPQYHRQGILDTIRRAADKLPRVDAIGGSSAGIFIDNEPRVASLFRGVSPADFSTHIRPLFTDIRRQYGNVPMLIANDGDVTALAGAIETHSTGILGIAMGTSLAAGFLDPSGSLTGWLNELAFVPIDFQRGAPTDEWSGDSGCGVQYFSQQAVGRLARSAGIPFGENPALPEVLEQVQSLIQKNDERAGRIYLSIGSYYGYALAWYSEFYDIRNVMSLGRVTSGTGGELIIETARKVLKLEFPEIAEKLRFLNTDETTKRHGQAVAAASLPSLD